MAVIANAKLWSIILQMVLLVQAKAAKFKREPYAVQEMSQESFSSGGDVGSYSPWSESSYSSDSGGGHFIRSRGSFGIGSGGYYSSHIGGLSGFAMSDSPSGSSGSPFGSYSSYSKTIGDGPHIISGGKSITELQKEAAAKFENMVAESKLNLKQTEQKVAKMLESYGYGTFGFQGYRYPVKAEPIDLGTHHGVDLGTTLDGDSIKDPHGNLKLPVQTVYVTKTVGIPIPEPYPIKHEVAVPAPYPVPVPTHHYSGESYPSSYSSDYSSGSGKTSYPNSGLSLSKVVRYHENLPKSTEKHYASASSNYVRYLPSRSSSSSSSSSSAAYRTSLAPTHYSPKQSVYEFK